MNVLFIHQNFPGQFRHLANRFASSSENRVVGICQPQAPGIRDGQFAGVLKGVYSPHRKPAKTTHPYLRSVESGVLNGQGVARKLLDLKKKGFTPDIAFAHIGWGEALYFRGDSRDVLKYFNIPLSSLSRNLPAGFENINRISPSNLRVFR